MQVGLCWYGRTKHPLVILSVAKDQPPVLDSPFSSANVPLAASIPGVEDSGLPT
jgi:hypothetical protein